MNAALQSPQAASVSAEAREAIADLLERYAHSLDDGDFEAWSGFFEADGRYVVNTRETAA
jgi:3-phenylpropionate/cinnamic acid dioxygenase small subunit